MKTRAIKLCALFLASLMLLAAFAACTPTETTETEPKVTETVAKDTGVEGSDFFGFEEIFGQFIGIHRGVFFDLEECESQL